MMKKIILFYTTFLTFYTTIWSQTPSNDCSIAGSAQVAVNECSVVAYWNHSTVTPLSTQCGGTGSRDKFVWFQATTSTTTVTFDNQTTNRDSKVYIYQNSINDCGSMSYLTCADNPGNGADETITFTTVVGNYYYVQVTASGSSMLGQLCVSSPPANDNCLEAINIPLTGCSSPISGTSSNASQSQLGCTGTADDDVWYKITATNTGIAQITVNSSASYDAVVQVFSGTCASLSSLQCVNATGNGGTETVLLNGLTPGQSYYIRVYHQGIGSGTNTFTICASDVISCNLGTGDIAISTLPYSHNGQTTCGKVNDISSTNVTGICGASQYYNGEDVSYSFTPTISGNVNITLTSTGSYTSLNVHEGCPTLGGICVGSAQSSTGNKSLTVCVTAGITYYVIVDSWPSPDCNPYSISITAPSGTGGAAANDLPCNAEPLSLGIQASGNNACAGSANEPAKPTCWSTGIINSIWYTVVAPASGQLKIRTLPTNSGTPLQNPQIAVYSGSCTSLTFVACNDNAPSCGGYTQYYSYLHLSGLTAGQTYYIVVDGNNNSIGTFEIVAIDGTNHFDSLPGQDCSSALQVCGATMTSGNPGFQAIGATCDFSGAGNCTNGEANSVWYQFTMASDGNILFNIVPNDYGNPNPITGQSNPGYNSAGNETDYDWVLWKIGGAGSTNCTNISSSGGDGELACNYSYLGVTGTSLDGNGPSPYGSGYNAAYEVSPFGLTGETFLLVIQNYSNSTSGFSIQFNSTPILYNSSNIYYWTGGNNSSNWDEIINWGGCGMPDYNKDAYILSSSTFQPNLTNTNPTTYNVEDIYIAPGASLTIQPNVTLNIYGNVTNNGNLICLPGSIIQFVGSGVQNITGSFVGTDAFHHFVIDKTSGSVVLQSNITVNGDLITTNASSILNTNGKHIRLGGNLSNFDGNTTFSNTGTTGTLHFIGTAVQNYNQGASQLDLNNVIIQNAGGINNAVKLFSDMFIKSNTGTLTLTLGTIITGAFRVDIENNTPSSVSSGNTSSFVAGNLWRSLNGAAASYDLPVGDTVKGYQRANISFTTPTNIPRLAARFDGWPSAPPTQGGSECSTSYNLPAEDNGYWTINASDNSSSGTYTCTLYPTNATNIISAAGWTVMKSSDNGSTWTLNGICAASTPTVVTRTNMNGFSQFGAAQSATPLPIELLSFTGYAEGDRNRLEWITASETNNDYFTLERSADGVNFLPIAIVNGAGNSNMIINYHAYDESPYFPISYYRLKQTDFNGDYSYSNIVTIASGGKLPSALVSINSIYPNPSHNEFFLDFITSQDCVVDIEIIDMIGRIISFRRYSLEGNTLVSLDGSNWAAGVYAIKVRVVGNDELILLNKIIKQ